MKMVSVVCTFIHRGGWTIRSWIFPAVIILNTGAAWVCPPTDLVLECKPEQVTLVPDAIGAITSSAGWDTIKNQSYLTEVIQEFQRNGIRTSIFVDPILEMIEGAKKTGTDRIELYTEAFAHQYGLGNQKAIEPYTRPLVTLVWP